MADIFCDKERMTRERYANTVREVLAESYDILRHSISALPALQDGEEAEHRGLAPEREAAERRKVGLMEPSPCASHSAQRPREDALLRNFQIPRKNKEQKALFQYLAPESREFEDIMRILNTSYLEPASVGTFAYTKARLVHSELLDKGFCEKRRELKTEGRTDCQLQESYRFLLTDGSKLPDICDKGLHVGHSRVERLGNPALGVCLSRYSDLLQINPFDVGASGEVIIFKVIKGKVKDIFQKKSKRPPDPTPGFDCHVSKKASSVTSLLSYRAFEITQQYFYEYNFDVIRPVPRHVCPYAVVSFLFKGRQVAPTPPKPAAPLRFISRSSEASAVRSRYTVWRGRLQNRGQLVSEVSLCSSCRAFLPVKLPETLEMDTAMTLDQVKQKIPTVLLSLNTYGNKSEVMQSRLYCSLFEVEGKEKGTLTGLMMALEREAMVLVKPVIDSGFLLLLSSAQMVHPEGRCGGWVWQLQALFIFQESRGVTRLSAALLEQQARGSEVMGGVQAFLPALQYAEVKLRSCSPANMAAAAGRLAGRFLSRPGGERPLEPVPPAPSRVHSLAPRLHAYLHRPATYGLPVRHALRMLRARPRTAPPAGTPGPGPSQGQYDPTMMTKLLNIIKTCKKNRGGPGGQPGAGPGAQPRNGQHIGPGKEEEWPSGCGLKRKCEDESTETPAKHLRRDWESSTVRDTGQMWGRCGEKGALVYLPKWRPRSCTVMVSSPQEYLRALGKEECDPEAFLQRPGGTDRLLVVMENQDIATHLHKVPGLVALKRQGVRVSFVGVDGLGDLQNCSYDELLASGGFLVPDEFLLRPDFITHERLQTLLTSLEGRSSPENTWCWKIHCKTRKKLKELGRSSSEALGLVNLLFTYQKRHLVEFLPYHHCDASDRRAPDLPCLIHLQAQNTHYRHTVFLTERRAEMFPGYSDNGIVIANIDDVTNRFEALVGTCGRRAEPQVSTPPAERHPPPPPQRFQPPPPLPEDLHPPLPASRNSHPPPPPPSEFNPPPPPAEFCPPPPPPAEFYPPPPPLAEFNPPPPPPSEFNPPPPPLQKFYPPLPCLEDFWPPLPVLEYGAPSPPAQLVPAPSVPAPSVAAEPQSADALQDLDALRLAISQFKASRLEELELGGAATFDPYHSFLSPPSL
ncbi:protein TASOR [Conger conger]|uniref:protein TASOR n=1 Tax=Conger conger TaxID=82655 RepID=UPI002A5A77D1|nr:protein TASOR [Conger conger]